MEYLHATIMHWSSLHPFSWFCGCTFGVWLHLRGNSLAGSNTISSSSTITEKATKVNCFLQSRNLPRNIALSILSQWVQWRCLWKPLRRQEWRHSTTLQFLLPHWGPIRASWLILLISGCVCKHIYLQTDTGNFLQQTHEFCAVLSGRSVAELEQLCMWRPFLGSCNFLFDVLCRG